MYIKLSIITIMLSLTMFGCDQGADSPRGFSLPKGDIVEGEIAFKKHQCLSCHSIEGYTDESIPKQFDKLIRLDVTSSQTKTYAQLVTSIINPSHKIAAQAVGNKEATNSDKTSNMRVYNDVMTVTELIDIVTFLQPKYKIQPMNYTQYQNYYLH